MLRSQFEEDLEKLHNQFYAMGQEVLSQINRTVRAFVTHDRDFGQGSHRRRCRSKRIRSEIGEEII